jgi:SAM-dependent methyltransferase
MQKKRSGAAFWDAEYAHAEHLALSTNPSEDLEHFTRWLIRESGRSILNVTQSVLDLGCGNGRNIMWLARTFHMHGIGYDISTRAVKDATERSRKERLPLSYTARSIAGTFDMKDSSHALVLDMMTSHVLCHEDRISLIREIHRVLKPGGYLFYKTFLLDEDAHAKRMIRENPAEEKNSYIHPSIGVAEHVSTITEIEELYAPYFTIHKILKSHRHKGKHAKRRSVIVYLEKPLF